MNSVFKVRADKFFIHEDVTLKNLSIYPLFNSLDTEDFLDAFNWTQIFGGLG